jgi:hypothetical protein
LFRGLKSLLLLEDGGSFAPSKEEKGVGRRKEGAGIFVLIHNPMEATTQKITPYTKPMPTMAIGIAQAM